MSKVVYCPNGGAEYWMNFSCTEGSSDVLTFTIGESFKLKYEFFAKNFTPRIAIPLDSFDFKAIYTIKGRPEEFVASKVGDTYTNCKKSSESSFRVLFDNYPLKSGQLHCKFIFSVKDPDFEDGTAEMIQEGFTNIILKDPDNE